MRVLSCFVCFLLPFCLWSLLSEQSLTQLHSERPKLHTILAFLSAIGLRYGKSPYFLLHYCRGQECVLFSAVCLDLLFIPWYVSKMFFNIRYLHISKAWLLFFQCCLMGPYSTGIHEDCTSLSPWIPQICCDLSRLASALLPLQWLVQVLNDSQVWHSYLEVLVTIPLWFFYLDFSLDATGACLSPFWSSQLLSYIVYSLHWARYRLKYCLKGPLNPRQPTNPSLVLPSFHCVYRYFNCALPVDCFS